MVAARKGHIYCSGPLFSPEERAAMASIAEVIEKAGHTTFLPQRDGAEMLAMRSMKAPAAGTVLAAPGSKMMRKSVFALDLYVLLELCDAVVVNLNGRVPDEGSVVEASLAFAAGLPVLGYKHDVRAPFRGMENPMLSGVIGWSTVPNLQDLPAALETALALPVRRDHLQLSDDLREVVAFGKKIKSLLDRFPALRTSEGDAGPLMQKLMELGE